jgi:formylglycine-generating enzyme required for sulfatase activity
MAVTRSSTATWVLPTVDEWYKAAYYAGGGTNAGYWTYATQSNDVPSNVLSSAGTNNENYSSDTGFTDPTNLLTPVGEFAASSGSYGTFDMGGDVYQWNETANFAPFNTGRDFRGGSFAGTATTTSYLGGGFGVPTASGPNLGFRIEAVPEPSAAALLILGAASAQILYSFRRRRVS